MRNRHSAGPVWMLEFDVATGLMRLAPPLRFKPADDLRALHVCNYTQQSLIRKPRLAAPPGPTHLIFRVVTAGIHCPSLL